MAKAPPSTGSSALSRRRIFAGAGVATAAAAAAAMLPRQVQPEAPEAPEAKRDTAAGGYQVTQHVLRYYQTTKV